MTVADSDVRPVLQTAGPTNGSLKTFQIRMGQTADFGTAPNAAWPHSFMATAFDLANPPHTTCFWGCVHIFNKQAVAHRLAVAARRTVYGESALVGSGPTVTGVAAHGSGAVVTYGQGTEGGGIALRSKYGFEVCAKDCEAGFALNGAAGPFVNATITGSTKTTVTIAAPAGFEGKVAMVRYGWDDMPSLFYGTQIAVCELRTPFAFRAAACPWPPSHGVARGRQRGGHPRQPGGLERLGGVVRST